MSFAGDNSKDALLARDEERRILADWRRRAANHYEEEGPPEDFEVYLSQTMRNASKAYGSGPLRRLIQKKRSLARVFVHG